MSEMESKENKDVGNNVKTDEKGIISNATVANLKADEALREAVRKEYELEKQNENEIKALQGQINSLTSVVMSLQPEIDELRGRLN